MLGQDCDDSHVDQVTEGETRWVKCLPGAFEFAIGEGGSEDDLEGGLCTGFGGVESEFFGCAKGGSANVSETIARVPVAGAAVLDEPLFIDGRAIDDGDVVGDGQVFDKGQVVDAVCGVEGGGWQGNSGQQCGLNADILSRVDDEGRFDEQGLGCGRDEGRRG